MPRIIAVGTALPPHVIGQKDAKQFARNIFGEAIGDIDRLIGIFDNAEIESRHFCMPLDWFATTRSFKEKNDLYIEHAIDLSSQAIERCLRKGGLRHEDIDYLLFVSTTGLSTPSIDAQLIERLPFRRDIRRLPLWGLGCAGGASSLARAMEIARAIPSARVLVVVTELCGLTFMRDDLTKSALIATSLFADGSAAVLVAGAEAPVEAPPDHLLPHLLASYTNTLDDSLDVMGWRIGDDGFRVLISRDIPAIVKTFMRDSIETFLAEQGLTVADITHFIAHPGGAKVLEAYAESLDLSQEKLAHTRHVLQQCGNMSACSVIFVLQRFIDEIASRNGTARPGEYGLLCALGPGFSSEQVLVRWESGIEKEEVGGR